MEITTITGSDIDDDDDVARLKVCSSTNGYDIPVLGSRQVPWNGERNSSILTCEKKLSTFTRRMMHGNLLKVSRKRNLLLYMMKEMINYKEDQWSADKGFKKSSIKYEHLH